MFHKIFRFFNGAVFEVDPLCKKKSDYEKVINDLQILSNSLYPKYDISKEENFYVNKTDNIISFNSKNFNLVEKLEFKTLRMNHKWEYIGECVFGIDGHTGMCLLSKR